MLVQIYDYYLDDVVEIDTDDIVERKDLDGYTYLKNMDGIMYKTNTDLWNCFGIEITNHILIYESFYAEWEILEVNIPKDKLEEFLGVYLNWYDRGINLDKWLGERNYKIEIVCNSDIDCTYSYEYIKEEFRFFTFDYLDEE